MSSAGATAQDSTWKSKEQAEEARYAHQKEQEQLEAIRRDMEEKEASKIASEEAKHSLDRDFEGGFGGQEDLEDRYATTSGEH